MENKPYITVRGEAQGEFTEKKSRFIGSVCSTDTEEKALAFIAKISSEFYGATHNVWCYTLREGGRIRFSDAGEPSGTAGRPALEVLTREGINDVCLVVTRYFGGVLLGAGGLTRAYAAAAKTALDAAGLVQMSPFYLLELIADYSDHARLVHLAADFCVSIEDSVFSDKVRLFVAAKKDKKDDFIRAVRDATAGRVKPAVTGTVMRPLNIERGE